MYYDPLSHRHRIVVTYETQMTGAAGDLPGRNPGTRYLLLFLDCFRRVSVDYITLSFCSPSSREKDSTASSLEYQSLFDSTRPCKVLLTNDAHTLQPESTRKMITDNWQSRPGIQGMVLLVESRGHEGTLHTCPKVLSMCQYLYISRTVYITPRMMTAVVLLPGRI
ncbi:uncharacterized protein BT62DRAFT_313795 [Guyanagaster necrorhizus]|uniref:Uncharacterized protein n=1 Tax=Guyanagaster necrorhizus TaxID=856835 RepID=A0A9P8APW4_9AGAR|nr:uncharacterized protein BT62DRAFT_313795 [Guyanagaster necrorhizus MCA 3950]KAG7443763.1 hypothetical protein BT62DRAFT_313795 [Guyanagaster necrorhizus MCA 3950]